MTDTADSSPQPDLWSCIRRDFLAGETATLLAERHAVSERTIRRHAAMHGWRRRDEARGGHFRLRTLEDVLEDQPSLIPLDDVNVEDKAQLLLHPTPDYLRHFAFKRAAEEAAVYRPVNCLAWMRVVAALERSGDRLSREEAHFSLADRIRAAFVKAHEDWEAPTP
jgi:hypothetical protein